MFSKKNFYVIHTFTNRTFLHEPWNLDIIIPKTCCHPDTEICKQPPTHQSKAPCSLLCIIISASDVYVRIVWISRKSSKSRRAGVFDWIAASLSMYVSTILVYKARHFERKFSYLYQKLSPFWTSQTARHKCKISLY